MADKRPDDQKPKGAGNPNRINRLLMAKAKKDFADLSNLVMVRNKGLEGEDTVGLRADLREKGIKTQVVRNRITMRAFIELGVEEAEQLFNGPTLIIQGPDPVTAAKTADELVKKFKKGKESKVEIIGGLVEGKVVSAKVVNTLAKMPSREELLAKIAGQIKGVGGGLAGLVKGPGGLMAGAVKAHAEKLEEGEGGEAEAA